MLSSARIARPSYRPPVALGGPSSRTVFRADAMAANLSRASASVSGMGVSCAGSGVSSQHIWMNRSNLVQAVHERHMRAS